MIGILIAAILAILVIGIVLKIIKIAVILAICVGIYLALANKLGAKRLK
jgi:hypothetical protein